MPDPVRIALLVNDVPITVAPGTTVASAILIAGVPIRRSVAGEPRGPLCGMGICFECRATIDGAPHQRTCQVLCAEGMEVRTS
ncbi:MAG: (2Fe-2S)-binding protein [Terracidiphilus sp.]|jgi:sarcosine oxidase subunit alpha